MGFSERIRELRHRKKLSQTKLGELIGVHYTQVGKYEKGEALPSVEVLRKLADVFEVSIDFLMEGSSDEVAQALIYDRELLQQFKKIQTLNEEDRKMVKTFLDALITKRQIQNLAK